MYHVSTRSAPRFPLASNLLVLAKDLAFGTAKLQTLLLPSLGSKILEPRRHGLLCKMLDHSSPPVALCNPYSEAVERGTLTSHATLTMSRHIDDGEEFPGDSTYKAMITSSGSLLQ